MKKEYYSAKELAGMDGMPKTQQGVAAKAKKEAWQSRPRTGKGGGKEFHISSLPQKVREVLAKQSLQHLQHTQHSAEEAKKLNLQNKMAVASVQQNRESALAQIAQLKGNDKLRAESKLIMLDLWQSYVKTSGQSKTAGTNAFLLLWSRDQIQLPEEQSWIRDFVNANLSLQTLYSWEKALKTNTGRIWGDYGHRKGKSLIDQDQNLREFIIATLYEYPHISATQLNEAMQARFKAVNLPALRSLARWIKNYKEQNAALLAAVTAPDKWKNKYMPAFGAITAQALNERWELDSTPADIMLSDGRYNLLGAIDVYSRRVKLIVSKSSTADAVASLLRECLLDWGVPQTVKTDNGADYVSRRIKNVFQTLDIEQNVSAPFSPWEKPHIERFFRTFSHDLLELMEGFIGHNVAERSVIEDRKQFSERLFKRDEVILINKTSQDLQIFVDDWVDNIYMNRVHSGELMAGKTPMQRIIEWEGPIQTIQNARALDILLADIGQRVVGKDGIRMDGFAYIAPELGPIIGQTVDIRKDPHCVGTIYVFKEGEFICTAEDARYTGISRQEIAHQAKQNALAERKVLKKQVSQAQRRQKPKQLAEEILDASRERNNVAMLPKRTEQYSNDMLEAAAEAALETQPSTEVKPQPKPELAALAPVVSMPVANNPQEIHKRYLRIKQRLEKGGQLSKTETTFYNGYHNSPECIDTQKMMEEFGMLDQINE